MPAVKDSAAACPRDPDPAPAPSPFPGKVAEASRKPSIIDIRREIVELGLKDELVSALDPAKGPRSLPTLLLYDEKGLQIFEEITYLEEYYLTNFEIEVLERHAAEIAEAIPAGSMVIELGSGNLRKICILLQAFEAQGKPVEYYALDLSLKELERTLAQVPAFEHVSCHGLHGTYEDGAAWLKKPEVQGRAKCIIQMGSSIGNFLRPEAVEFLEGFARVLQPADSMIVGIDSCHNPDRVYHAYNDREGTTHRFILNGLTNANSIYGEEIFHLPDWRVIGEYVYDHDGGRHQAFVSPIRDTVVLGSVVASHERLKIEQSAKYSEAGYTRLWAEAGFTEQSRWTRGDDYGLHFLRKTNMSFSLDPSEYARGPLPSMHDWETLWQAWDVVTQQMLPQEELKEKPIKLRNACIFYLGHIPTFLDIQLTKTTGEAPTHPEFYYSIFERGVDPDVDNPEHCHAHSLIPDDWPPVNEILAYQERVRGRLTAIYESCGGNWEKIPRVVGRALWLAFEHEVMHIETLLYMMLQSDRTVPPLSAPRPDFEALAQKANANAVPNEWFSIPEQVISVGMDDPEDGADPSRNYGWDNEKPPRKVKVHAFKAQGRAITNEEYARYVYESKLEKYPASWSIDLTATGYTNGQANGTSPSPPASFFHGKSVRTIYGLVALKQALDWPVFASYDELAGCAAWMGGRIPTFEEARSIYAYVHMQKKDVAASKLTKKVPAVNAHLVNDGVEETPPSHSPAPVDEERPSDLFIDLAGSNVGFTAWHPTEVTSRGGELAGQAGMGGAWEWTSTSFAAHEGFEPMPMYPAYSSDFFDGKHNVVLGGSWATHPRVAGRKSFVNWYQRNYPYVWAGARLVRDL